MTVNLVENLQQPHESAQADGVSAVTCQNNERLQPVSQFLQQHPFKERWPATARVNTIVEILTNHENYIDMEILSNHQKYIDFCP